METPCVVLENGNYVPAARVATPETTAEKFFSATTDGQLCASMRFMKAMICVDGSPDGFLEKVPGVLATALQKDYTIKTKGKIAEFVSFLFAGYGVEEDFVDAGIIPLMVQCLGLDDKVAQRSSAAVLFSLLNNAQHREAVLFVPGLFEALESLEDSKVEGTGEFELLSRLNELRPRGTFVKAARFGSGASSAGEAQQVGSRAS